ncbi:MAG: hypothetical protein QHG99_03060 [Methanomicrobiales archaeon]|nr:hypothetical protein [Methanomicrobiales archaeon]
MEEIVASIKKEDGIQVAWQKHNQTKGTFFTYAELIDMKINALDLLENPKNYLLDLERRLIVFRR